MSAPQQPPLLAQLQRLMIDAVYGAVSDPALLRAVRSRGELTPESLLAIYRNGTRATLTQALRISYPVVERLVGEPFFEAATAAYQDEKPSRSGDLEQYGADFGAFLDRYDPAASAPYLPDVARLEWCVSQLRRSPMPVPLSREQLATIPHGALTQLRLSLSPRVALFCSDYPVFHIWQENRDRSREPNAVSLAEGADCLLIIAGDDIETLRLSEAGHAFYRHCDQENTLAGALDAALAQDPEFDFAATLSHALERAVLCISRASDETQSQGAFTERRPIPYG